MTHIDTCKHRKVVAFQSSHDPIFPFLHLCRRIRRRPPNDQANNLVKNALQPEVMDMANRNIQWESLWYLC